jgi:hypothetical protein
MSENLHALYSLPNSDLLARWLDRLPAVIRNFASSASFASQIRCFALVCITLHRFAQQNDDATVEAGLSCVIGALSVLFCVKTGMAWSCVDPVNATMTQMTQMTQNPGLEGLVS